MKKCYLSLSFLLAIVAFLLLTPVSLAAVHHTSIPQHSSYGVDPGTAYYSFSSANLVGPVGGVVVGGLTLHINADGSFQGTVIGNASSVYGVVGNFQSDGSMNLVVAFRVGHLVWQGTAQPQKHDEYVGTFTVTGPAGIIQRSGIWSLVPVEDPNKVIAIDVSAFTVAGTDMGKVYSGVMILDEHGKHGTLRLQDGRVMPVLAQIAQNKLSFTFFMEKHHFMIAIGAPTTIGTTIKYIGTFVGPAQSDNGNWSGYPFSFIL